MKKFVLVFLTLCVVSFDARSQTVLTLNECIDTALLNNSSILINRLEEESIKTQINSVNKSLLPEINSNVGYGNNWGQTIDPFTNEFASSKVEFGNFNMSANFYLFNGLSKYYRKLNLQQSLQISKSDKKIIERNVKVEIATIYLQIELSSREIILIKELIKSTEAQIGSLKKLINTEKKDELDLKYFLANRNKLDLEVMRKKSQLKVLKSRLSYMVFGKSNKLIEIDSSFKYQLNKNVSEEHLVVKKEEQIILLNSIDIKQIKSQKLPKAFISSSIGTGYSGNYLSFDSFGNVVPVGFSDQLKQNFYQTLSFNVSIPILSPNNVSNQIAQKKIEADKQLIQISNEKQELLVNIKELRLDILNLSEEIKLSKELVVAFKESHDKALKQYNSNYITYFQLKEIEKEYQNARLTLMQIEIKLKQKQLILSYY